MTETVESPAGRTVFDQARTLLATPQVDDGALKALGAALLAATTAILLAGAVVLGSGWEAPPAAGYASSR